MILRTTLLVLGLLVWCRDLLGVLRKQPVPLTISISFPWGPALQQSPLPEQALRLLAF